MAMAAEYGCNGANNLIKLNNCNNKHNGGANGRLCKAASGGDKWLKWRGSLWQYIKAQAVWRNYIFNVLISISNGIISRWLAIISWHQLNNNAWRGCNVAMAIMRLAWPVMAA